MASGGAVDGGERWRERQEQGEENILIDEREENNSYKEELQRKTSSFRSWSV